METDKEYATEKDKTEYVWTCEYCGKEFESKEIGDAHELKCELNTQAIKSPEIKSNFNVFFNKFVEKFFIIGITSMFIGIPVVIYWLIKDYLYLGLGALIIFLFFVAYSLSVSIKLIIIQIFTFSDPSQQFLIGAAPPTAAPHPADLKYVRIFLYCRSRNGIFGNSGVAQAATPPAASAKYAAFL